MNNKLKPALLGGLIVGLLSAIPFLNIPNICCCLWAIIGGAVGCFLYIRSSASPVRPGDGAIVGVLSGAVGALIYLVLGVPLAIMTGGALSGVMIKLMESVNPAQAEELQRQMMAGTSVAGAIMFGFVWAILLIIFSTIGGLIAVPIFEKRKGPQPPASPPGFGR
ncbi:MAG TPA: hypothetical protein DCK93_18990 [Blastocatellia bacterium]|nr:hypothetical protein [Blastocatellia bacterium]